MSTQLVCTVVVAATLMDQGISTDYWLLHVTDFSLQVNINFQQSGHIHKQKHDLSKRRVRELKQIFINDDCLISFNPSTVLQPFGSYRFVRE